MTDERQSDKAGRSRKSLTSKERARKKRPGAWLWLQPHSDTYYIMPKRPGGGGIVFDNLGSGNTPKEAWANAAKRLK